MSDRNNPIHPEMTVLDGVSRYRETEEDQDQTNRQKEDW